MNIIIRPIQATDAADVAALSAQLGYTLSAADTKAQIEKIIQSNNDTAYVALDNDKPVAWVHVFHNIRLERPSCCEIGGLVVDTGYRSKGVGKMLVDRARFWGKSKGCNILCVRSNVKREEAREFYEHLGFFRAKQQNVFELSV